MTTELGNKPMYETIAELCDIIDRMSEIIKRQQSLLAMHMDADELNELIRESQEAEHGK